MLQPANPNPKEPKGLVQPPTKRPQLARHFLDAIDETPEFHDPYSELSLFLSQRIKQEMRHCSSSKKWSHKLQDELIDKIRPDFEKRFPRYRLGVNALKKTWEKVHFYSSQIQDHKEALTQDGKLNIPFLIKENLKTLSRVKQACQIHPYHYAHQLAVKMGECIAIVDGTRPKLDQLTRTIWSVHKHLIPKLPVGQHKSPYDDYDRIDKLIVKLILEITAEKPWISQCALAYQVRLSLRAHENLLEKVSEEEMHAVIAKLAERHRPLFPLVDRVEKPVPLLEQLPYSAVQIIEREIAQAHIEDPQLNSEQLALLVCDFFQKVRQISFKDEQEELERKINVWTMQSDMLCRWIRMNQESALYTFVSEHFNPSSLEESAAQITEAFRQRYPQLTPHVALLGQRVWALIKHLWYVRYPDPDATSFERFLKWHIKLLMNRHSDELIAQLSQICQKMLPLVPFDGASALALLQEEESQKK